MKNLNLLLSLFFIVLIVLTSCNSRSKKDNNEYVFEEIQTDTTLFDLQDSNMEDSIKSLHGKGETWKTWLKLHKECMKAQWLTNPYYFGVSSTVNLGAIVDKKYFLQRTMDSTSGFTESDLNSIMNYGNYTSCGYTQEMTMSLDIFLKSEFDFTQTGEADLNIELQSSISNSRKTKVKIDNWRVNNLIEDNLIDLLTDPNIDSKKRRYFETLKKPGHYILTKVIEIKGFTSYIELERDMSAGLEAKLKEGIIAPMGNIDIKAKFTFKDKRTIEVKSGGNFYVFGQFRKVKEILN